MLANVLKKALNMFVCLTVNISLSHLNSITHTDKHYIHPQISTHLRTHIKCDHFGIIKTHHHTHGRRGGLMAKEEDL